MALLCKIQLPVSKTTKNDVRFIRVSWHFLNPSSIPSATKRLKHLNRVTLLNWIRIFAVQPERPGAFLPYDAGSLAGRPALALPTEADLGLQKESSRSARGSCHRDP